MSSDFGPLLVGLAAAGSLLVLIGIVRASWSLVGRIGMRLGQRQSRSPQSWTSQELVEQPRASSGGQAEPLAPTTTAGAPDKEGAGSAVTKVEEHSAQIVDAERQSEGVLRESEAEAERVTEDALRQARELLEETELEAKRILVAAGQERARRGNELEEERAAFERLTRLDSLAMSQEAERKAEELLAAAELQCESLVREAEAEAQRKAAEITEDARRLARKLLEEAELEAKGIVVAVGKERAGLMNELAHERSVLEEERNRLDSLAAIARVGEHKAQELLVLAERQSKGLRRESEAEAERITKDARRQARKLLEEAELEATRVIEAADRERATLVEQLAKERSVLEETRTRLSGFLTDVLDEVEGAPAASEGSAVGRDLGEALAVRTSAGHRSLAVPETQRDLDAAPSANVALRGSPHMIALPSRPRRDGQGMERDENNDPTRAARNEILLRDYNERMQAHHEWVNPSFAEWVCECADQNCSEPVQLSIQEYEAVRAESTHFLIVPSDEHVSPPIERVVRRDERYWIVEKIGVAAEISDELDPRSP